MEISSRISSQATRKLEDDHFIIGTGLKYDRMRQDARQLQRSKFKETRSKANFARFRNAALKCSVEATAKRIEQEKSMRMKEIEWERGKVIAIQKKCGKCLLTAKLNPLLPGNKLEVKKKRNVSKKTMLIEDTTGGVHSLNPSSACAESWMQGNHSADLDSRGNDLMTTLDPEEKHSSRSQVKTSAKSNTGLLEVGQFTPYSQSTLSRKRGSLPSLSDTSSVTSLPAKDEPKGCDSLCRSSSTKTIRIHSVNANVKKRNTVGTVRHPNDTKREKIFAEEKKKEFQVWKNFDELLKWFADFMQIEYKPRLMINESDVTKDAHAQNAPRVLMPKRSINPLYFQYGIPENVVIRLC